MADILNIGYGNLVPLARVVVILQAQSAPVKRLRDRAAQAGRLIDATQGRKTRAVLVMDGSYVILSAVQTHTLAARMHSEPGRSLVPLVVDEGVE